MQFAQRAPDLIDEPWFVGMLDGADVKECVKRGGQGDFVVRESQKTPNSYVVVVKDSSSPSGLSFTTRNQKGWEN